MMALSDCTQVDAPEVVEFMGGEGEGTRVGNDLMPTIAPDHLSAIQGHL